MSRLIDADKLIEDIEKSRKENPHTDSKVASNHNLEHLHFIKLVNTQPTAYDVDKVISNIWDRSELIHIKHNCYDEVEDYIRVTDVTQIVKVGGMGRDEIFDRNR